MFMSFVNILTKNCDVERAGDEVVGERLNSVHERSLVEGV